MDLLNHYLFLHKSISIPGLGTLHMDRIPARTDFVNRQLLPPGYAFRFDKYFDAPDKDFFGYVSAKKNIPDFEAIKWYNEFSYALRSKIRNREEAKWEGLGSFHTGLNGEVYFKAENNGFPVLQPVTAERVLRNDVQHAILVGDQERTNTEMPEILAETFVEKDPWWTYAIIIAAIALSICCYRLFSNGMQFSSMQNQQNIPSQQMPILSR